jgi:acyl-CoA hydrolase
MEDWWRSEDGTQSFYREPGTLTRSCGRWVTLNPVEVEVLPGETMTTRLTVKVSSEAEPGGYWCVLTVDEMPDPLAVLEGVGIRFMSSVSVGVFVNIGEQRRAVAITAVEILNDVAVVKLRNDGNTPLAIEGRFEFVKPGATEPTAVVPLTRSLLLTEPILTGAYSAKLPDDAVLPSGRYLVRAIIDYGVDHYIGTQREMDVVRGVPIFANKNE